MKILQFRLDLLQCTNEPNVSIPQLANLLIERTQHSSWIVVFKALITVHHLMCYGNEVTFLHYLINILFEKQNLTMRFLTAFHSISGF